MCRITACIMVITHHAIAAGWDILPSSYEWSVLNDFAAIAHCGVPIFFMISGTLFLSRPKLNIQTLYKRNILRLLEVYVIWSLFYTIVERGLGLFSRNMYEIVNSIINGPFHLWYIPALIMTYLVFPLVYCAIHNGKLNVKYLVILFLALFVVKKWLMDLNGSPDILEKMLDKADVSYFRYAGFAILGYWLSTLKYPKHTSQFALCLFALLVAITSWINWIDSMMAGKPKSDVYGHFSILMVCIDCAVFIFFQTTKQFWSKFHKTIETLAETTLGIYLIHPMVLGRLSKMGLNVRSFNPLLSVPVVVMITAIICFICVSIMKKIPIIRKMV